MKKMRTTTVGHCRSCQRDFTVYEIVQYIVVDNHCVCTECSERINKDDSTELIPTLYIGPYSNAKENLLAPILDFLKTAVYNNPYPWEELEDIQNRIQFAFDQFEKEKEKSASDSY